MGQLYVGARVYAKYNGAVSAGRVGTVTRIDDCDAFVHWDDMTACAYVVEAVTASGYWVKWDDHVHAMWYPTASVELGDIRRA